jgi:hypothetical protein
VSDPIGYNGSYVDEGAFINPRGETLDEIHKRLTGKLNASLLKDKVAKPDAKVGIGGGPSRATILPDDPKERKKYPLATGLFDYFPDALAVIANVSWVGNEQHNPGQPLHWDRSKSQDEADTMLRHFSQRGSKDTDGTRHLAKAAWRMLAMLQKELEEEMKDAQRAAA